jgi:hypothetical protein
MRTMVKQLILGDEVVQELEYSTILEGKRN